MSVYSSICDGLVNFSGCSHIWHPTRLGYCRRKKVFMVNQSLAPDETKRLKTLDGETSTVYD